MKKINKLLFYMLPTVIVTLCLILTGSIYISITILKENLMQLQDLFYILALVAGIIIFLYKTKVQHLTQHQKIATKLTLYASMLFLFIIFCFTH